MYFQPTKTHSSPLLPSLILHPSLPAAGEAILQHLNECADNLIPSKAANHHCLHYLFFAFALPYYSGIAIHVVHPAFKKI